MTHFEREYLTKKFVKGILGVPISKRLKKILISPKSLVRTNIWSSSIADLKVSEEVFVRRFRLMGKSKTHGISDIADILEGVEVDRKRTKRMKSTARASSTADGPTEGLPLSSIPLLKSADDLDVRKIEDVTFNVEPSVFTAEGHFELLEDVKFREGGLSCESGRLVAQAVKNLHAAVLMDKDVVFVEWRNYVFESSVGSLEERVRKLEAELSKQVEETKAAKEKMMKAEEQAARDRVVVEGLCGEMEKAKADYVLATRRK